MKNVRITVIRKVCHKDLMERYENPIEHACDLQRMLQGIYDSARLGREVVL